MYAPGASFPAPPSHSIDRIIETLIDGLVELGQRVLVFAPASSEVKGELIPVGSSPVLLKDDPGGVKMQAAHARARKEIDKRRGEIQVVHAHSIDIPNTLYSTHLLEDLDIPNVTTLHSAIDIANYNYFSKCKNRIIACSQNQVKACPSMNFFDIVYHGLDCAGFPFVDQPDDYLCFLGRIAAVKQPHLAMQLAIQHGMPIKVAGEIALDESGKRYFAEIEPLLSHPLVEYLGEIGFDEKIQLLSHARCNLHPTGFREPFGLSVVEAGFCGTPTLAIRRGALSEVVREGETGVLVEDFVEGCYRLDECMDLDRRRVSEYSRARFNHLRMAYDYIRVYRRLLDLL
jgi:glycosyltransferase involved in cell wall biosynthesis